MTDETGDETLKPLQTAPVSQPARSLRFSTRHRQHARSDLATQNLNGRYDLRGRRCLRKPGCHQGTAGDCDADADQDIAGALRRIIGDLSDRRVLQPAWIRGQHEIRRLILR